MVRVLVIEDDVYMRELIGIMLAGGRFLVTEAASGAEGISRQNTIPSQVVITDMGLPDCDGLEVIRSIQREHPTTLFIAMSGGGMCAEEELFPMARSMGVCCTLTKPFHLREMLDGLAKLVCE
jgi:two-component system, OmpR family, KDP operon response regulator KdpE